MVFMRAKRGARAHPLSLLATAIAPSPASRPRSFARSFCFSLPPHPQNSRKPIFDTDEDLLFPEVAAGPSQTYTRVTRKNQGPPQYVLYYTVLYCNRDSDTSYHNRLSKHTGSLVTQGACSPTDFSRPPAQLAGSLSASQLSQKAPSGFHTLYIRRNTFRLK